ncbi:MAG: DUF499 domain-containing protein [Micropepsaceae bacterium]
MSLQKLCKPRPSVFAADRRATVLNLDTFLKGQVSGAEFFEENYFTHGMEILVDSTFRHLSGKQSGSSVFVLSQAMGGGKTHSMIALGLLARQPELRKKVLAHKDPAPNLGRCRVVGFNGRNTDAPGGIWGSIAEQLGKFSEFASFVAPMLNAPGPEAWKKLLGGDPLIIFLDELPPYLEYAVSVPVGNGDLGLVTSTALANLFVAVADTGLENVCVVLSDLAGTNYSIGQQSLQAAFGRSAQHISNEAKRAAVPITPVNPNGDELYHILRKRLFETIAPDDEIKRVATAYRDALAEAVNMKLTATVPQSLYSRVVDSYPFHPDLRELVGRFKENEGFQQTRGVIRLMQMVVSDLWKQKKAEKLDLIAPYDIDLNADEIASEIRTVNSSLSEAIAHDIARNGTAEVEEIDKANGSADASEAAKLVLVASLATTPGAIHGLREYQLVDCLQKPGRDLSTFKSNVLDKLAIRAWYLHNSSDGRLFFKNQQNLAAKLRATAMSLHAEVVDRLLREHLESYFGPTLRDCYQSVHVLKPIDEVQLDVEKSALVIVRPGEQANQLPISSDWQAWWNQQQFKNRVLFLTGTRNTYQKVIDAARQVRALQSIQEELEADKTPPNDPQWKALDGLTDRVALQFNAALKEAFDQIVYPSINTALRTTSVELAFAGNSNGEATIRKSLETATKFTPDISGDSFRLKAEARLFGGGNAQSVLWSDLKRNAATSTTWPLHKPSALDDLKADAIRRDLWREEGNYVRKGPFPPPMPSVEIFRLSTEDDGDGKTYLKIEPLHAPNLVFEVGDKDPTRTSLPVPTPAKFEATELRYRFMAFDPNDMVRVSPVKDWTASIRLKHRLHDRGDHHEVELLALPRSNAITIRYTTDGSSPTNAGAATYSGPFRIPAGSRIILAVASSAGLGINSEQIRITPPLPGVREDKIDVSKSARWTGISRFDDPGSVWNFVQRLTSTSGMLAFDIHITAENEDGSQAAEFQGAMDAGYDSPTLKSLLERLQDIVGGDKIRMSAGTLGFPTGQALLEWLKSTNQQFDQFKVKQ